MVTVWVWNILMYTNQSCILGTKAIFQTFSSPMMTLKEFKRCTQVSLLVFCYDMSYVMTRQGGVGTTSVTARRTPFEVRFFSSNLQYIALASFVKHMREKDENQTQNSLSLKTSAHGVH